MFKLLPTFINEMGDAYPELKAQRELIGRVMKEEEDSSCVRLKGYFDA